MLCSSFSALQFSPCSCTFWLAFTSPVRRCPQCRHPCVKQPSQLLLYSVQRSVHFEGDVHLHLQLATNRGWMNLTLQVWLPVAYKGGPANQIGWSHLKLGTFTLLRCLCIRDPSLSAFNSEVAGMCGCDGLDVTAWVWGLGTSKTA